MASMKVPDFVVELVVVFVSVWVVVPELVFVGVYSTSPQPLKKNVKKVVANRV